MMLTVTQPETCSRGSDPPVPSVAQNRRANQLRPADVTPVHRQQLVEFQYREHREHRSVGEILNVHERFEHENQEKSRSF